jgi:hypothetical protein
MRRPVALLLAVALSCGVAAIAPALSGASPKTAPPSTPTKGIGLLINNASGITDAQAMSIANSMFPIIAGKLHANAVSLNFPFYETSSSSNVPERAVITPSPQRLAAITIAAHRYHLAVEWRPYLFEGDLHAKSRPTIKPTNPNLWISNYAAFLEPYLIAANQSGAAGFSIALELTTLLPYLSSWTALIDHAKTLFSGTIFYSQQHQPMVSLPLTARGYDAYQPIPAKRVTQISPAFFTTGFLHNFQLGGMQETPADLTIEELGIAAINGSYNRPFWERYPPKTKIIRSVQEDWFQGACNAFWALHLQGMYFWAIGFDAGWSASENNTNNPYGWFNTPTENIVSACYARTH